MRRARARGWSFAFARSRALAALALRGLAGECEAANGLNTIGFGLESNAMAGADLAVARDAFALNTNPAGLAQVLGLDVELHALGARQLGIEHDDGFGPTASITNENAFLADAAVAGRSDGWPVTLGGTFTVTGGGGYDYGDVTTAFGTQDNLSSLFGIVRASAGGSYEATDRLALGASLGLSYSLLDQEVFPDTFSAEPLFVGMEIRDAAALGTGFRLGARYRASEAVTLGLAFGSEVDLPVRDGELRANLGPGLGKVGYEKLRIDGLAQAAELGAGVAWQVTPDWLLAADLTWLDWSDALGRTTLRASDPDDPRAPPELRSEATSDWRDQWVVAVGTAYRPAPAWTLWAGYNYGRNPIPNDHLSPLLPNIGEHHLTGGVGWQVTERVRAGLAVEYLFPNEVDYANAELPLGDDLRARTSYVALHLGLRACE